MSLFLGKIHYWLFNKITWFENLEEELKELTIKNNIETNELEEEIKLKYGSPLPKKDLKDLIDTGNIHGWLQDKINKAEGRMAMRTKFFLENTEDGLLQLRELYKNQGVIASKEERQTPTEENPENLYSLLNDYILDGMPCDRANEVLSTSNEEIIWKRRVCTHSDNWENEGVKVNIFYDLRNQWIEAFINETSKEYTFKKVNDETFKIIKTQED